MVNVMSKNMHRFIRLNEDAVRAENTTCFCNQERRHHHRSFLMLKSLYHQQT